MASDKILQFKIVFSLWANDEHVTTFMMPILEINEYPVRKLKICVGCWYWGGHKDTWCNNVDPYAECSYIDTPQSHIVESYALLRTSQRLLFEMMTQYDTSGITRMKEIIRELKDIIKFYEKHI